MFKEKLLGKTFVPSAVQTVSRELQSVSEGFSNGGDMKCITILVKKSLGKLSFGDREGHIVG